jgi:hypothetical protein
MFSAMLGRLAIVLAIVRDNLHRAPHWLAIAAMLIQFVASYGHFHTQDYRFLQRGHAALSVASAHADGGSSGHGLATDLDCPICTSIQALGSSALPDSIRLPMPVFRASLVPVAFDPLRLTPPPHLLFDTRGPPSV